LNARIAATANETMASSRPILLSSTPRKVKIAFQAAVPVDCIIRMQSAVPTSNFVSGEGADGRVHIADAQMPSR
jgi:hypothetical protein